ncbi:hypothetical protein Rhe02_52570 [Rhizocola hellebori]|uniref:Bulb-type lectin domain-containing protein n=1 Tax=Rhizocola hellebori TaxID=1392758 RepID=A0A8J3QCK8_9ACTN|nr:hypothetical protein [Rhizocola hellebori]GIH07190.1 hypothetical protein Rhe02_52570 [Rhizocola hellebori]
MRHADWSRPARRRLGRLCVAVTAALLTVIAVSTPAAAATVVTQTTWGSINREDVTAVAAAPDGGFYLTGATTILGAGEELFLVKIAADGSLAWQRSWKATPNGIYEANDVTVASDGSVYVTGVFAPNGTQAGDVLLLKFSANGALIWQRIWDSGNTETGEAVAVASDGSIYVSGGANSLHELSPLILLRFAPDGTLVWQRTWANVASGDALAISPNGNIHVAGVAPRPDGTFHWDMVLLTVTPQGTLLWQRDLAAGDVADARGGLTVAPDGSIYVAGGLQAIQSQTAINDTLITKFSPTGSLTWVAAYGGNNDDFPGGVVVLPNGTLLVGGVSQSPFVGGPSFAYLLRVDTKGKGIGCNSVDGSGLDEGEDVALAANQTVVLGATTTSRLPFTLGSCPQQTRNLNSRITTTTNQLVGGTGVVADPNGTVSTPGGTAPGPGGFDAALIRVTIP